MKAVPILVLSLAAMLPAPIRAQPAPGPSFVQPLSPPALGALQDRLRQQGFYTGRVDGAWGPESQTALERFQQARGLQVSGQVNAATLTMLGLDPVAMIAPPPAAPAADPLSPPVIRMVQHQLRRLGHYRGSADGVWGPGTQRALERFQQANGLQSTGQMNPATAQALGLDPNNLSRPVPR